AGGMSLSAPPKVPIAVRMAETRKTSVMSGFPWRKEAVRERGLRARLRPSCAGRSDRLAAGRTSDVGARAGDDQLNNYFNKCSIEHGAAETPPAGSRRAAQAPDFPRLRPAACSRGAGSLLTMRSSRSPTRVRACSRDHAPFARY